jgi:hypothetical protein
MGYYDNILNLFSLVLVLAIFFIVLFGCQFKKYRKLERFSNKKEFKKEEPIQEEEEDEPSNYEDEKKEETKETKGPKETKEPKESKEPKETTDILEGFEGQILEGLTSGTITSKDMDTFISAGTFTRENLENIISYVEKFKNQFS